MAVSISRPRVYLIDFETAVYFSPHTPEWQRICVGRPIDGSLRAGPKGYGRPIPPEVAVEEPYDPYKLDVWQLGASFSDFHVSRVTLAKDDHLRYGVSRLFRR